MLSATRAISLIKSFSGKKAEHLTDYLPVEEPLEIRLVLGSKEPKGKSVSITMRTPGHDSELGLGFLFTEGIITSKSQIAGTELCGDNKNTLKVYLSKTETIDLSSLDRNFYMSSSCGVCGKASTEAIKVRGQYCYSPDDLKISKETVLSLAKELDSTQEVFRQTGGLHASALFDKNAQLLNVFEDVGRHNALDKLIGHQLQVGLLPLNEHILLLSGRISFELVQKAALAGIKFICAFGSPSSLALELCQEFNITLIGFLKDQGFNIYHGKQRLISE